MVSGIFNLQLDPRRSANRRRDADHDVDIGLSSFLAGPENILLPSALATFEKWMVGEVAATDNPLVICGQPGLGKSHLVHGLAAKWKQQRPQDQVILSSASDFVREHGRAAELNDMSRFRHRYSSAALCLIDDLQHLSEKTLAQSELQRILDGRQKRGLPLVATASRVPSSLGNLFPGLASRLGYGLCISLRVPGREVRCAILKELVQKYRLPELDGDALDGLARRLDGATVPELRARILDLRSQFQSPAGEATSPPQFEAVGRRVSTDVVQDVIKITAKVFALRVRDLTGPSRRRTITQARSIAIYLARRFTRKSLHELGTRFGRRDHTTVLHACRMAERLIAADESVRAAAESISEQLLRNGSKIASSSNPSPSWENAG